VFGGRFSSSIGLVGVDFGTRSVRLLQVREQQNRLDVVGAAHVELPNDDAASDREQLTQRLHSALGRGGFTGRRCVVSIPRDEVRVQSVRLPRMPAEELAQAAKWEAAQRFGFDREAMEADHICTGATLQSGDNREEVLLIASSHAALHRYLEPVMAAGLRPVAAEPHFSALARIFSRQYRRDSDRTVVRAIVEIGVSSSTVIIVRGDQIAFTKPIAIGGRDFNQALVEHLELEERAAAELRTSRIRAAINGGEGALDDSATERAAFEAVRPLLGDVVKEVVLCLRYYGVTFRGHPPERIILAGGDGLEPRLDTMLAQTCKIPVVYDEVSAVLEGLGRAIQQHLHRDGGPGTCWAIAAGLSARGIVSSRRGHGEGQSAATQRGAAA
jgi:type IV pilus assembly protein PilM